ncbi:MAG TPA: hydrogenase iron-sulfur subunit [Thermodesulfobacteriaceae bacterium]|nr:hydrogenase iron-sulfur subunit [Thermodesulfobacteriaceae bacterium]
MVAEMSISDPKIIAFCCNYTASVDADALKAAGLVSENFELVRLPCTGRLEVVQILDALDNGAEAVFVTGCLVDECHNLTGSRRASKRVQYVKGILEELDIDPGRVEMFFAGRGETEPVVEAAREMKGRVTGMEPIHK